MKQKIFISSIVMTGLLAVGAIGVLPAGAEDSINHPPIVQRIAEHFGLNQDEVADVFEEVHAEHHTEMLANFEDRLSEQVASGGLTEDQKQAILDKHEEMRAKMEELMSQNLTREEMHQEMRTHHEGLRAWTEEQGIDIPFMTFKFGGPHHGGGHMFIEKLN
jgi:hypothetical protein